MICPACPVCKKELSVEMLPIKHAGGEEEFKFFNDSSSDYKLVN